MEMELRLRLILFGKERQETAATFCLATIALVTVHVELISIRLVIISKFLETVVHLMHSRYGSLLLNLRCTWWQTIYIDRLASIIIIVQSHWWLEPLIWIHNLGHRTWRSIITRTREGRVRGYRPSRSFVGTWWGWERFVH
jgi:hypothetical protein